MTHIFISYRSEDGDFADLVKNKIKDAGFDIRMDNDRINAGQDWRQRIDEGIKDALAVVLVMTPEAQASEYVTYEWAFALGCSIQVIPIMFKATELHPRLEALQYLDFTNRSARRWDALIKLLRDLSEPTLSYQDELKTSIGNVAIAGARLQDNQYFRKNRCFQHIITQSLNQISTRLADVGSSSHFSVSATQYPQYLIALQRDLKTQVKAVALVDQEEKFWQDSSGREIARSAHKASTRVFVFTDVQQFNRNFETLLKYATFYNVYAMSFENLTREFEFYDKDFSIIEVDEDKVLAVYDDSASFKSIRFSVDPQEIAIHEEALDRITRSAMQILNSHEEPEILAERIFFSSSLTQIRYQPIEMSGYIVIDDYDQYEEKHAYYQEMMQRMINIFVEHSASQEKPCRVLELGSGTGIFTKRLASLPEIEVVAIEIDWVCYNKLQHKLKNYYTKVAIYNRDSRIFRAEGNFQYIFSSFADHHIKPEDKAQYFENIKRNLAPGGMFIVGDEFLPPYNFSSRSELEKALKMYHNHIIEIAQQNAKRELDKIDSQEPQGEQVSIETEAMAYLKLVELEQNALEFGLEQKGDFKISCEQYEATLRTSGFEFKKEKIGPLDQEDVGGVYVYIAWLHN